ncbi:hypothetical protein Tco_1014981, partial [Tanacetum coccineum]
MVMVPIHQDTSSVPPMTSSVIDLTVSHPVSKAVDEIVTDAVDWVMQAPLQARFHDLPAVDMKEILQQRMFEDKSYEAHEDHKNLYDALQKSLERDYSNQLLADLDEARKKKRKRRASGALGTSGASGSSQLPLPPPPPSTGTSRSAQQQGTTTYDHPAENSLLAKTGDMTTFLKWYCRQVNKTTLIQADFKGQAYEIVRAFYPDVVHLQFQMEECHKMLTAQVDWTNPEGDHVRIDVNRPLPLDGPPGHFTIQPQFFFNTDVEYLRYGNKGSNHALSISMIKVASYPDFGIELLVPEQMWIDDVCTYDISAKYGISHWWFNQQKFYIDRHDSSSRRKDVRTHMRILSVIRIKAYSRYKYDCLSE